MNGQDSDEAQVKFREVAAFFSEEEWKLLHRWQKEFYKNVMKEIHQALISLGYQIVNPDTLLKIYKGKEACIEDSLDPERTDIKDAILSSHPVVYPDILFRITQEDSVCRDECSSVETEIRNRSSACFPVVSSVFSLASEDKKLRHMNYQRKRESINHSSRMPFFPADVCSRDEDEHSMRLMDHSCPVGEDRLAAPSSGRAVSPATVVVCIEEDEETSSTDHPDVEIIESTSSPVGHEVMNRQRKCVASAQFTNKNQPCKASSGTTNIKGLQNYHKRSNIKNHLWAENYVQLKQEKTAQYKGDFSKSELFRLQQQRTKIGMSQKYNEYESNMRNSRFLGFLPNAQQNQSQYTCPECNKSCRLKRELLRHMETHSRERIFACPDCDKTFFRKTNLMTHSRTHTGEKPYACHICNKRFSRKDNLNGHIRIHTGERPYKCTECGRSFTWKGDLNQHRRKHT
ncbi:zinc finger protein 248-like [Pleurodeles waltl]